MNTEILIKRLENVYGCLIDSHTDNYTPQQQLESIIADLKQLNKNNISPIVSRYFKCVKCGSIICTTGDAPEVCTAPVYHRTGNICGGSYVISTEYAFNCINRGLV